MRWINLAALLVACRSRTASAPRAELEITTTLPGASAAVIESAITTPLERQLGQMPHLVDMRSRSSLGLSTIDLAFDSGTDIDASMMAVQQAINASSNLLPRTLPAPPTYHRMGKVIARYVFSSDALPLDKIREVIEPVAQRLSQLAGVGLVDVCGASPPEIHVDLDPAALAGAGLTPLHVVEAIQKAPSFDDPKPMVVATQNGSPIRLEEIAKVTDASGEPPCIATTEHGRTVELIVSGQSGVDGADVRDRIQAVMPQLHATLPSSVAVESIGVMHVLAIALQADASRQLHAETVNAIRTATAAAKHVLIEQRANVVRLGIEADDDTVATIRIQLAGVEHITIVDADATLELGGPDLDELRTFAKTIAPKLGSVIALGLDDAATTRVQVDRDTATRLGITADRLDRTLATLGGVQATTVFTQLTQTPVIVRAPTEPDSLDRIYVRSVRGDVIPLSTVVHFAVERDGERWHVGQFPMVGFRVRAADVPDLAELHVPTSVQVRLVPD